MSNPPTLRPSDSLIAPCCLTTAGSDSGGNAGVQADLRAFHGYGLHGCTVFAALTAQNPTAVTAIHPVPADFVAAQLDAVLGVYAIRGLKTGTLADPEKTMAQLRAGLSSPIAPEVLRRESTPLQWVLQCALLDSEGRVFRVQTVPLAAAPDDIRKRFLAAQAKWTPDMWAVFAKIVDSFTETKKPDTE